MERKENSIVIMFVLFGIVTILCGGCKKQEPAKLTISVEGKELSDAYILVDDRHAGSLTQTAIRSDGKIYINGVLAAKAPGEMSDQGINNYSGCSDTITLPSGKHSITLEKGEAKPLKLIVDISPGHHLMVYFSDKDLVKWDNKSFQVSPSRQVTVSSE